jgi:hypothetical protein
MVVFSSSSIQPEEFWRAFLTSLTIVNHVSKKKTEEQYLAKQQGKNLFSSADRSDINKIQPTGYYALQESYYTSRDCKEHTVR